MTLYVGDIVAENTLKVGSRDVSLRAANVLYVSKTPGPGEYSTPNAALAAITDNSSSNPYIISVGTGVYSIAQLTLKPYVWIVGSAHDETIFTASDATNHLVIATENAGLANVTLDGVTTAGKAAISYSSAAGTVRDAFFLENVRFGYNDTLVIVDSTTATSSLQMINCVAGGSYQFNHGFLAQAGGKIFCRSFSVQNMTTTYPDYVFKATGSGSEIIVNDAQIRSGGTTTGAAIDVANGATAKINSVTIKGFAKAIWIENTGSASTLDAAAVICESNTMDLQVDHAGADGTFSGSADHTKVLINTASAFNAVITSNSTTSASSALVTIGSVLQGDRYDRLANLSFLARQETTLGQISGGAISVVSGLQIAVTSGVGFLNDVTNLYVKEVDWSATNITLPANSTRYIYVDSSATVVAGASLPSLETVISLGRVVTNATGIRFIEPSTFSLNHTSNKVEYFLRNALGPVFNTGGTVTENATPRKLNITAGNYFFGISQLSFNAANAFTFEAVYRDGSGGFIFVSAQDTLSNTQYDNNSGTLQSIPVGNYAKHTLYGVGNGTSQSFFVIYSQGTYASQAVAEGASLPVVPSFIAEGVVPLAEIIVKQGVTNIVEIIDIRPRIGFAVPSSSAATAHGNLTGLTNDDHPQYLILTGARAMIGNLDMGNQAIINSGLINGVSITAHASRHLPNGADPLTTGTPVALGSLASAGVANSFARSDHVHPFPTATDVGAVPGTRTISAGSGLTGGGDLTADRTISMPAVGTAGTYGSVSAVPVFTTDAQGRVTSVTNSNISINTSAVSNFSTGVLAVVLNGYVVGSNTALAATDTILAAFGKVQGQLNAKANLTGGNSFTGTQTIGNGTISMSIAAFTSGTTGMWVDLPTTGPSGLGTGGAGSNAWIGYCQSNGHWFGDSLAGDIAYRNTSGRLLWGHSGTTSDMRLDTNGWLTIGPAGVVLTNNPLSVNGNFNSFLQVNVQNLSTGTSASGDLICTADNGSDTDKYIDMGVNSSTYADPNFTINGPNDGYLYVQGGDLSIGTGASNKIVFFTGGTLAANEKARITPAGLMLLGTTVDNGIDILQLSRTGSINFPVLEGYDDFLWTTLGSGTNPYSIIGTTANGGTVTVETASTGNNYLGMITLATGTTNSATGVAALDTFNASNKVRLGGNRIFFEQRVRIPTLSTASVAFTAQLGLQDASSNALPTNGVFFTYTHSTNSGRWVANVRAASTSTTVNSTVTVNANQWYKLRAEINAARTQVDFYIDGVLIGSVTTNIPAATTGMRFVSQIYKGSTSPTSSTMNLDYIYWKMFR